MNHDPKIIERIKKLMALSLSDNPHEAQLAAQKLVELMNKHGVTDSDLENNPFITDTFESKKYYRLPVWASALWTQLGYASGCYVTWSDGYKSRFFHGDGRKAKISISGRKTDVEIVRYIGDLYEHEIYKKSEDIKKQLSNSKGMTQIFNKYKYGLAHGIAFKIQESQKEFFAHHKDDAGMALVPIDIRSKEAQEWNELNGRKAKTRKTEIFEDDPIYLAGIQDAQSITVNKGVTGSNHNALALEHKKEASNGTA